MRFSPLFFAASAFASQSVLSDAKDYTPSPSFEGDAAFHVPCAGVPTFTHYQVYGTLKNSSTMPLVVLNGGPGAPSPYMRSFTDIAHVVPVVLYDQLGSGLSTHLRHKVGDASFWTDKLFVEELDNLLVHLGIQDNYAILGHSWGGMLASRFAVRMPSGLKKLVLASSPCDAPLWVEGVKELVKGLPQDLQDALNSGDESNPLFAAAVAEFYARHVCRLDPMPQDLQETFDGLASDNTVYLTMWGPSEVQPTGSLKNWTIVDELHKIHVPTLVTSGFYDEARRESIQPFLDLIPDVRSHLFMNSAHMSHYEDRAEYMRVLQDFLLL